MTIKEKLYKGRKNVSWRNTKVMDVHSLIQNKW